MPELERPDGARIHYQVRGDGPPVVLTLGFATYPAVYEALSADLARDHRVVTWDPRGCGRSTGAGPLGIDADAADLLALLEALGEPAVVFAVAHGVNVTARAARVRPDLVRALVSPGIVTALVDHLEGSEGFASSRPVIEMLVHQLRTDPRGAMRATIASLNPQLDEDELRERIERTAAYSPAETMLERIESWLDNRRALDELRALGARVHAIWHEADPWQTGASERIAELLPEARIVRTDDGPLSRPDLAAAVVREAS